MNARFVLVLSLVINALLGVLWLRATQRQSDDRSASAVPKDPAIGAARPDASAKSATGPLVTQVVTQSVARKFDWESVESPDYREYIRNLKAIGCPEETIRDIILADVNKLYDSKRKQVRGKPKKFEYWKPGIPMAGMMGDAETMKAVNALEEEKNKVLRDLGIQPDPIGSVIAAAGGNALETMFDFIPESKRAEVMKLMTESQTKMAELAKDGTPTAESMMTSQREMEEAIRKALTPEEFLDYQLRFSTTANMLRQQITGFDPSEEEFLKVFKLKEEFDREYSPFGMANETEAEQRKRTEAMNLLNGRVREALGNERYSDYERAQDYSYQQLYQIAKKADLAPAVANEVYSMKRAAEQRAQEIRIEQRLEADQKQAALKAIRDETERSMQQALGDKAWDQYNRPNNTWWLRGIAPNPVQGTP